LIFILAEAKLTLSMVKLQIVQSILLRMSTLANERKKLVAVLIFKSEDLLFKMAKQLNAYERQKEIDRQIRTFKKALRSIEKRKEKLLEEVRNEEDDVRCIILLNCLRQLKEEAVQLVQKRKEKMHSQIDFELDELYKDAMK
jgi:septal ring factor EnvC (AmiA/AmiB activator)